MCSMMTITDKIVFYNWRCLREWNLPVFSSKNKRETCQMIAMLLKLVEREIFSNTYVNEGQHYGRGVGENGIWGGLPFTPPEKFPEPGVESSPVSPKLKADSLAAEPSGKS